MKKVSGKAQSSFIRPQTELHLRHVEQSLQGKNWLTGNTLSGADIMMSYPLQAAAVRSDLSAYPNIRAYLARIEADEAYQRAVTQAGQPMMALR